MESRNICKNCNSEFSGNFCNNCGQKSNIERYTVKRFFTILFDAFNIKRGILFTFRVLFKDPGKAMTEYLGGRTIAYFNPLNYLLIAAGIYAIMVLGFDIFDTSIEATKGFVNTDSMQANEDVLKMQENFNESVKGYINLIPLFLIPFASLLSKWYHRSAKLYYGEHLIVTSFFFAQGFYISLLFMPLVFIFPLLKVFYGLLAAVVMIVYLSYALNSLYKRKWISSILGSIVIYFGGMLFFYLTVMFLIIILGIILGLLGFNILDLLTN